MQVFCIVPKFSNSLILDSIILMPNQSPLREPLEAAEGVDVEPCLFHDVGVGDAADRLVADGAAGGHLAPRADAFEVAPLSVPAKREAA